MMKVDKQDMDAHGVTCKSKDVCYHRDFRYERMADVVRYAE